jgi:hypothetical protein
LNADGVDEACKSNESFYFGKNFSGERVSNTWVTYLKVWNNVWKRTLIPNVVPVITSPVLKRGNFGPLALRAAHAISACWSGNGTPRLRRLGGSRG